MQQIDSLNAVAVGDSGLIYRTFDGGVTWSRQFIPGPFSGTASIWSVYFHDSMNGIICLPDQPATTSDGGLTWTLGPYTGISFPTCHCYGAGKFAVFNSNTGVIYRTSNNWATMDSTQPIPNASNLFLALRWSDWTDGDTIIGCGFDSSSTALIMRTTNSGQTWSQSELPQGSGDIDCMSFISDDTLLSGRYSFAQNSILFSSDNGQSWVSDSVPTFTNDGLNGLLLPIRSCEFHRSSCSGCCIGCGASTENDCRSRFNNTWNSCILKRQHSCSKLDRNRAGLSQSRERSEYFRKLRLQTRSSTSY